MDTSIDKLKKEMGTRWNNFYKIHNAFISFDEHVTFRIFPIYVIYTKDDKLFAVIYFKGRLVDSNNLIVGLGLSGKPESDIFEDASYINYSGINYYINLRDTDVFDDELFVTIKQLL
jgi:hypothetical protein